MATVMHDVQAEHIAEHIEFPDEFRWYIQYVCWPCTAHTQNVLRNDELATHVQLCPECDLGPMDCYNIEPFEGDDTGDEAEEQDVVNTSDESMDGEFPVVSDDESEGEEEGPPPPVKPARRVVGKRPLSEVEMRHEIILPLKTVTRRLRTKTTVRCECFACQNA